MSQDLNQLKYPIGTFDIADTRWNKDPHASLAYIRNYPKLLWDTIADLTDDQMQTPYRPEGWTVTQLVHHISDSHTNAFVRFKLALTEDNPTIKPYKEASWVQLPDTSLESIGSAMSLIRAIHEKWSNLMDEMHDLNWKRTYFHPGDDRIYELNEVLCLYHWHCAHHLAHITSLIKRNNW